MPTGMWPLTVIQLGWYNQASAVPQEQYPQSADTRQMVSATQPNGPTFTSLGQKVLCKSACSPSISFTPVGQNRSMNKSSVVPQDKHSHKPQLPLPKVPSQNAMSLWKMFWGLYLTLSQQLCCLVDSNPNPLLHSNSPCPQPLGKGTALTNDWVLKPDLATMCISSSKTTTLPSDHLEEELCHLHKGIPCAESSLPSLDHMKRKMLLSFKRNHLVQVTLKN